LSRFYVFNVFYSILNFFYIYAFGGSTIPVYIQATQPCHPSVGRCSEYRRLFRHASLGRNDASEITTLWRFEWVYKKYSISAILHCAPAPKNL